MRKKFITLRKVIKRIVVPPSKGETAEATELALLKKELEQYPENDERYTILRKKIIRKWLLTHSKNGSILKKERVIEICYNRCNMCPLKKGKEGCVYRRKFFNYDFCFRSYLLSKEKQ